MLIYQDKKYNFYELFNPHSGFLIRSDINGQSGVNPAQRSFPELLDIGIVGHCHVANLGICSRAGIDCYQAASRTSKPDMSFDLYSQIVSQCRNQTFQIALGGAGDPNKHERFIDILKLTRDNNIVPNYTTTGMFCTDAEIEATKKYCGAVAISHYSRLQKDSEGIQFESNPKTTSAIRDFISAGCIVNVHFVISKDTVREALYRLKNNLFPSGIHAVIFLLYKPVGLGTTNKVLSYLSNELIELISVAQTGDFSFKVGFDTCCTPAIIRNNQSISSNCIDFCDAARFSMYIDCEGNAYPCSFCNSLNHYSISVKTHSIKQVWESAEFEHFRQIQEQACGDCLHKKICLGGCALGLVNLCPNKVI